MGKLYKKLNKNCEKHLMTLTAIRHTANKSKEISHIFCRQAQTCFPTFPKFNKNMNNTNHGFILPQDQAILKSNTFPISNQELQFSTVSSEESELIWVPKPKQLKCQICKTQYEDYKKHISSENHIKNHNSSLFNKEIISLCQIYGNNTNQDDATTQFEQKKEQKIIQKIKQSGEEDSSLNSWVVSKSF